MRTFPVGILSHCMVGTTLSLIYMLGLSQILGLSQLNLGSRDQALAYRGSGRLDSDVRQLTYRGSGRLDPSPTADHSGTTPVRQLAHRGSGRIHITDC
jgi:hypothetical protein